MEMNYVEHKLEQEDMEHTKEVALHQNCDVIITLWFL